MRPALFCAPRRDRACRPVGKSVMSLSAARAVNRHLLEAMVAVGSAAVVTFAMLTLGSSRHFPALSSLAYGTSLFCCCFCSLLHDVNRRHPFRRVLRLLDHSAIFLLIAGTYTPFAISGIAGPFGLSLLGWVWGMALFGIMLRLLLGDRYEKLFVLLYLAFGWLFLLTLPPLVAGTPSLALALLGSGGTAFSVGAVFYWRHAGYWADTIWHGFVLGGISLHFAAVLSLTFAAPV